MPTLISGAPASILPSTNFMIVLRLAESLALVSDGPKTRPGWMVTMSQRSCSFW